ncbi:MAG: ketopantoate reductase family protein [Terriglobales bacterium]
MKHAILGAGGVGGLVGGMLSRAGHHVTLLLRPETYAKHPDKLLIEWPNEKWEAPVERATSLSQPVDVLWVTPKEPQLESALKLVGDNPAPLILPLLNGIDHMDRLRARFGKEKVIGGTIAVEAERVAPGHIVRRSPFLRIGLGPGAEKKLGEVGEQFRAQGAQVTFFDNETVMLWLKLSFLAPIALTNTAVDGDLGKIYADAEWTRRLESAIRETCAVAKAEGAPMDAERNISVLRTMPPGMRASMQKDVAARRIPELDAIAGPILRRGASHGIDVRTVRELTEMIEKRWQQISPGSGKLVKDIKD